MTAQRTSDLLPEVRDFLTSERLGGVISGQGGAVQVQGRDGLFVKAAMVAGIHWINTHNLFPHGVPYAGVGMGGGVLSVLTLLDYWRSLSVVRPL